MGKISGFNGSYTGLTDDEVRERQERYGKNELAPEKRTSFITRLFSLIKEPMFLLLFVTALIYFLLGEVRDGIMMLVFVTFMSGINVFQEWRTDRTLQALKDLSAQRVKLIRNGGIMSVDSREVTVDDLMLLEEGEKIAADGQIVEMHDLGVDESTLTGESEVVWKTCNASDAENHTYWRRDYCYAGTTITQGSALVKVTGIGHNTEYGKIGMDLLSIPQQATPLEKQIRHLIKICALIGLVLFIMVFIVTLIHTLDLVDSILSGITLVMAMIPEEFPVVLTVFLSMGAWRLAKKNSLIRRMPSLETLGSVSVLCVDKTGTLTQNQMVVQELYRFGNVSEKDLLYWAALGCETQPYDPMEKAILDYAESLQINRDKLFNKTLLHEYPFSSETKMMGHIWEIEGRPGLAAKGAPERILPLCGLDSDILYGLEQEQNQLARKGFRVIAVAHKTNMTEIPGELQENRLDLLGLIGLEDPPRESVPESVAICTRAGIRIVMITGDNGTTAQSIGKKIGLANTGQVLSGVQLDGLSDEEVREKAKDTNIFARVIPGHKMRIVKALKEMGETVAMTGDGVNDAPALKMADIGIAMGKRGTEVAKEAADMILLDDNFSTIVDTVRDGRRIYDNIKKAIGYIFVIHIPIALTALLNPILHLPLLLLPVHVVLLELIIDPTCSIIFERQPEEKNVMQRRPRSPKAQMVDKGLLVKAVFQGLAIFAAAFGSYAYLMRLGWNQETARTFSLIVIAFANLFLVHVNQSDFEPVSAALVKFKDKVVWYVNGGILAALAVIVYLPAANEIVKTRPLSLSQVVAAVGLAALATFWWEAVKFFKRRTYSPDIIQS
ncbi:MAG: cation-translocating P-type ATPase [Syntrophomonas sp.]